MKFYAQHLNMDHTHTLSYYFTIICELKLFYLLFELCKEHFNLNAIFIFFFYFHSTRAFYDNSLDLLLIQA